MTHTGLADLAVWAEARMPRLIGEACAVVDDRTTLLNTLSSHLDHEGSAGHAAVALYRHPNTVRYRLRRLQEHTGRSLAEPHSGLEAEEQDR